MSGLETAFYIIAIICMSLGLILLLSLVIAIIVIRNKIASVERMLEQKFQNITLNVNKVVEVARAVGEVAKAVKK